jgi:hypothetical protein
MIKWTGPTGLAQTWPGPNRLDLVEPGKTPARPLSLATPLTRTHTATAHAHPPSRFPSLLRWCRRRYCCSGRRRPSLVPPKAAAAPLFSLVSSYPRNTAPSSTPGNPNPPPGGTPAIAGRFRRRRPAAWLRPGPPCHLPLPRRRPLFHTRASRQP